MGTVETESKVPPVEGSLPGSQGNAGAQGSGVPGNVVTENGAVVSGCGNRGFGSDGVVEVVKSSVIETETKVSVLKGSVSQGLADSEMNGVSSLLKMRGSGKSTAIGSAAEKLDSVHGSEGLSEGDGTKSEEVEKDEDHVIVDVPIMETCENMDVEVEDLGDEGYGFSVGDFVWGKIKSHPWWPGRVYDPSAASDYALKIKQKNRRLLVAYFGDGTFAWCHPSQLRPFEENFGDMVKQSGTRSFVNAVQEAVDEFGRLLCMKMSSSFVANKTRFGLAPQRAKNAGIKEGVLVPEDGVEKLSAVAIEPPELLSRVKQFAEVIAIASILELEILKAQLSAFYLSRGGYELTHYEDPHPVPGLEDSLVDETVDVGNSKSAVEVPVQRPFEECNSPGISGNRSSHRRKQKSIAEILGEDKDVHDKNKEGDATGEVMEAIGSIGRKRRKDSEDGMTLKQIQRRKALLQDADGNVPGADNGDGGKENGNKNTELKEMKEAFKGSRKETDEEGKTKEQSEMGSLPSPRERKRSKYLCPPFTAPIRVLRKGDIEGRASEGTPRAAGQPSPRVPKCNGEENFPKEVAVEWELSDGSNHQSQEDEEEKTIDPRKIQAPPSEVLSEFCYAATCPQMLRESTSIDTFVDFISVFRSSLYSEGSLYEVYKKCKPGRKRKKPENDNNGVLSKDQTRPDHARPNHDSGPRKRRKRNQTPPGVSNVKGNDENASSAAALFVSFWPGSSLPSKSDLITVYSKFGALNEAETDMFRTNYTARVCFLEASDAEKALNHSQNKNPFGSSEVTFQLKYLSDGPNKSVEHGERSKSKPSQAKKKEKTTTASTTTATSVSMPQDGSGCGSEASKLKFIRERLQVLTSMLEASDGNSPDVKTMVVSEMKGLLEDVDKMVESSSS